MAFSLLAADYSLPAGNADYIRMPEGGSSIKVVIIDTICTGYLYWTEDKRCVRSPVPFKATPGIRVSDQANKVETPKHFWCAKVWSFDEKAVKILEITQRQIQEAILAIHDGDDYELSDMDVALRISAEGAGLKKKYTLLPITLKSADWQEEAKTFDLYEKQLADIVFAPAADAAPIPAPTINPTDMM